MRLAPVLALVTLICAASSPARCESRELTQSDLRSWLDGFLPYAIAQGDIAGAAVVVVRDGEPLATRGYGLADVARRIRVDPERTLFRTGSVGKLFTWTAVMQQVEAGTLDLDRDVNDYLDFRIPPRGNRPITLRNLMTHTPGFEEPLKRLVTDRIDRLPTIEAYVKAWIPARIFPPGEIPAYSNYGVTLAGYILERVTGMAYDDYVELHVFTPLGMNRSTTRQPLPERLRGAMSRGYALGSAAPQPFELFGVSPAGGASTTVTDIAHFMTAWLQGGRLANARLLRTETVRRVLETRLPIVPPLNGMLLGFYEKNLNGRRIAGHDGDSQFFHSTLSLYLDDGVGLYLVVNSSGRDGAAATLLANFNHGFADRYFPAAEGSGGVGRADAARHARQLAGTYMGSRRQETNFFSLAGFLSQLEVRLDGDGGLLVPALRGANGGPMRWHEVRPYLWEQVGGKERLAARLESGRVKLLGVDSVSPFLVFEPAPWWKSSAILGPLLAVALVVILFAVIAWPVTALVRRHYRLWPAQAGPQGRCWRWARLAGGAALALLGAWSALLAQVAGNLFAFSPEFDPWLAMLKLATLAVCLAGTCLAVGDVWRRRLRRGWLSLASAILLVMAFGTLLWAALVFRLAGFGTDY
jgi:CubicO group peptidase (beta-lactamase class C family)